MSQTQTLKPSQNTAGALHLRSFLSRAAYFTPTKSRDDPCSSRRRTRWRWNLTECDLISWNTACVRSAINLNLFRLTGLAVLTASRARSPRAWPPTTMTWLPSFSGFFKNVTSSSGCCVHYDKKRRKIIGKMRVSFVSLSFFPTEYSSDRKMSIILNFIHRRVFWAHSSCAPNCLRERLDALSFIKARRRRWTYNMDATSGSRVGWDRTLVVNNSGKIWNFKKILKEIKIPIF